MKKEDIEFLRELQHELNTQETDGQAAPRYWGIEETREYACAEGDGEPYIYSYDADCRYNLIDYVEKIIEEIEELSEDTVRYEELKDEWEFVDIDNVDNVVDFANTYLRNPYKQDFVGWIDERRELSDATGCFLTKRAAKQYLDKNYYHHNNGHTYAMTAWRNPEFERLLNILQTMNINDIKED